MKKLNRFICDLCNKPFPLVENGFVKYYAIHGRAVCKECFEKSVMFNTYESKEE